VKSIKTGDGQRIPTSLKTIPEAKVLLGISYDPSRISKAIPLCLHCLYWW